MTPEQEARELYQDEVSTKWWVHYPGEVYSNNIDFTNPVGVDEAIDCCLNWLKADQLPEGTEVYK